MMWMMVWMIIDDVNNDVNDDVNAAPIVHKLSKYFSPNFTIFVESMNDFMCDRSAQRSVINVTKQKYKICFLDQSRFIFYTRMIFEGLTYKMWFYGFRC